MNLFILALALAASDAGVGPCKATQTICFSPGNCDLQLIQVIDSTKSTLEVAIYSINRANIVDSIVRAHKRGVKVRVLVDYSQLTNAKEYVQISKLYNAGIPLVRDSHVGIMHLKFLVADSSTFAIGSFNYTDPAVVSNDETLFIWNCPRNALLYQAAFESRFNASVGFKKLVLDGGI